jgi:hypothetical protein
MKITLSKSQWQFIGKKAGWMKKAQILPDDGIADGGEPYTKAEMDAIEEQENKRLSFSFGTTPENIIKEKISQQAPNGYPMTIRGKEEWKAIADAVNKGIDSHLEGFTRSKFDSKTGECLIHPEEMTTFLRRLLDGGEESWSLRSSILETLGIEEI